MDGYITRVADEIADILVREGIDYVQSKAARSKAGLRAPKERRAAPARLTLEEQLRFIDAAYARSGQTGLMVQTLLETGTRVSEFVALRVEDVSLGERTITVESGKGAKRREIPIRAELARLLAMHIGTRRAGPLFLSRQKSRSGARMYTRQRIGQMVRKVAFDAGISKRIYPHLLRHYGDPPAGARYAHHRHPEVPRTRGHRRDADLRRDQPRHAPAQVRSGHRSDRQRAARRGQDASR